MRRSAGTGSSPGWRWPPRHSTTIGRRPRSPSRRRGRRRRSATRGGELLAVAPAPVQLVEDAPLLGRHADHLGRPGRQGLPRSSKPSVPSPVTSSVIVVRSSARGATPPGRGAGQNPGAGRPWWPPLAYTAGARPPRGRAARRRRTPRRGRSTRGRDVALAARHRQVGREQDERGVARGAQPAAGGGDGVGLADGPPQRVGPAQAAAGTVV